MARAASASFVLLASLVALSGCAASSQRRAQTDLQQLQAQLPGSYDSTRAAEAANPVSLQIQSVGAQLIGDAVFYVRETPTDNPRLVLAQRIWTLSLDQSGQIVQHVFVFKDPRRWVGAADNPELLMSMLPQDLRELQGCGLIWQHPQPASSAFEAHGTAGACHPGAADQGQWIAQQARLEGRQLTLTERRVGADGALATGEAPQVLTLARGAGASS